MRVPPLLNDPALLSAELARLNDRRNLGAVMMYLPTTGLVLLIASGVGLGHNSALGKAALAIGVVLLMLGLPTAPIGVALRIAFGRKLHRLATQLALDDAAALPPLARGDRLGSWRIARLDDERIVLTHQPGPWIMNAALRFGVEAILVSLLAIAAVSAFRAGHLSAWMGVLFIALIGAAISASLGGARLTIEDPGSRPSLRFSGMPVFASLRIGRWSVPFDELESFIIEEGLLIARGRSTHTLAGLGRGPFARWRQRALSALILGDTPAPPASAAPGAGTPGPVAPA